MTTRFTWARNHFAKMYLMFFVPRETLKVYGGNDDGKTCGIRLLRLRLSSSGVFCKNKKTLILLNVSKHIL